MLNQDHDSSRRLQLYLVWYPSRDKDIHLTVKCIHIWIVPETTCYVVVYVILK